MKSFTPQKAFLGLISTGSQNAVLSWRGLAKEGQYLWRFKDHIDRKWMKMYKASGLYFVQSMMMMFTTACTIRRHLGGKGGESSVVQKMDCRDRLLDVLQDARTVSSCLLGRPQLSLFCV